LAQRLRKKQLTLPENSIEVTDKGNTSSPHKPENRHKGLVGKNKNFSSNPQRKLLLQI